jgi:hypothetical protein
MNSTMNDKLNEAAAEVAKWQTTVWSINEKIATAETTLAASERRRRENALAASLGDADAQRNLDEVLQDDIRAVRDLENLRLALPAAEAKLREAEGAHRNIEAEIRKESVSRIVLDRIEAGKEFDRTIAAAGVALQRYLDLGGDIWPLVIDPYGSTRDQVEGWMRIAKSLPAPFADLQKRLPGVFFGGGGSLAQSEASYWNVSIIKRDAA